MRYSPESAATKHKTRPGASFRAIVSLCRAQPRLRFDQQPTCLVYLRPECHKQIKALPDAPVGENPDPVPRGKKLFVLRTRSVRAGTVFLSQGVLIMLDVQPKAAFNRDKGGKLNNAKWYASCRVLLDFQKLSPFAVEDDPWDENVNR